MSVYAQQFERFNGDVEPTIEEKVWVVLEWVSLNEEPPPSGVFYEALWKQYPIWCPPYNQSNPPPNEFEKWRHGWSSVLIEGEPIRLDKPKSPEEKYQELARRIRALGDLLELAEKELRE